MPYYNYSLSSDSILMHDALLSAQGTRDYFSPAVPATGSSNATHSQLASQLIQPMFTNSGLSQGHIPMAVSTMSSSSTQQLLVPHGTHALQTTIQNVQPFSSEETAAKLNAVLAAAKAGSSTGAGKILTLHYNYLQYMWW